MALTPKVLAVLKKVDAVHAEFFAVLEREARMKRPRGDGQGKVGRKPPRRQDGRQKPEGNMRATHEGQP